jgi:hypothetical protein
MKKVRSFSLRHEFERVVHAGDMPEAERHRHHFKCLNDKCSAAFHLVRGHRRKENTETVDATFARNPGSKHSGGCQYDFESIASHNQYQSFVQDDKLFLRINFPLGGRYVDRHPERGGLTREQRAAADRKTGKKPVAALAVLTHFLEKQFGSLQSEALEDLVLDYQGRSYPWPDVFTDADSYARLHSEAAKDELEKKGLLVAVKPLHEASLSGKGKRRFLCESQMVTIGGRREIIRPVIVCENDEVANEIRKGRTMLVASRPFIPDHVLSQDLPADSKVHVTLYVHDKGQIAPVPESTWRKPVLACGAPRNQIQLQLGLFDKPAQT